MKIVVWHTEGAERPIWYRVDVPGNGDRFFRDLLNNAETDGRETVLVNEVTTEQWNSRINEEP